MRPAYVRRSTELPTAPLNLHGGSRPPATEPRPISDETRRGISGTIIGKRRVRARGHPCPAHETPQCLSRAGGLRPAGGRRRRQSSAAAQRTHGGHLLFRECARGAQWLLHAPAGRSERLCGRRLRHHAAPAWRGAAGRAQHELQLGRSSQRGRLPVARHRSAERMACRQSRRGLRHRPRRRRVPEHLRGRHLSLWQCDVAARQWPRPHLPARRHQRRDHRLPCTPRCRPGRRRPQPARRRARQSLLLPHPRQQPLALRLQHGRWPDLSRQSRHRSLGRRPQ